MRSFLRFLSFALVALPASWSLVGCGRSTQASVTDIRGVMPPLAFSLMRVNDGKSVDATSYRGKVVALYFGYTHCPDECPTTLANMASVFHKLGAQAQQVRLLFVSVDPSRDTPALLKTYVQAFAPETDGLRGSNDAIAALARRYRVIYQVTPTSPGHSYEVTHSASLFVFDKQGTARFVTMSTDDTNGMVKTLGDLVDGNSEREPSGSPS